MKTIHLILDWLIKVYYWICEKLNYHERTLERKFYGDKFYDSLYSNTQNRVVISWLNSCIGRKSDSFLCKSLKGAKKIVSKRNKRMMKRATFFDCYGVKYNLL